MCLVGAYANVRCAVAVHSVVAVWVCDSSDVGVVEAGRSGACGCCICISRTSPRSSLAHQPSSAFQSLQVVTQQSIHPSIHHPPMAPFSHPPSLHVTFLPSSHPSAFLASYQPSGPGGCGPYPSSILARMGWRAGEGVPSMIPCPPEQQALATT